MPRFLANNLWLSTFDCQLNSLENQSITIRRYHEEVEWFMRRLVDTFRSTYTHNQFMYMCLWAFPFCSSVHVRVCVCMCEWSTFASFLFPITFSLRHVANAYRAAYVNDPCQNPLSPARPASDSGPGLVSSANGTIGMCFSPFSCVSLLHVT